MLSSLERDRWTSILRSLWQSIIDPDTLRVNDGVIADVNGTTRRGAFDDTLDGYELWKFRKDIDSMYRVRAARFTCYLSNGALERVNDLLSVSRHAHFVCMLGDGNDSDVHADECTVNVMPECEECATYGSKSTRDIMIVPNAVGEVTAENEVQKTMFETRRFVVRMPYMLASGILMLWQVQSLFTRYRSMMNDMYTVWLKRERVDLDTNTTHTIDNALTALVYSKHVDDLFSIYQQTTGELEKFITTWDRNMQRMQE